MLETIISSKTRIKLLLKFFLNSNTTSYLRSLSDEFNESSNGIRVELNRFEKAGMLVASSKGNKKYYKANVEHPLYQEIHNIVLKYVGFDKLIENVLDGLGEVKRVYVVGDFAKGKNSHVIDLMVVGKIDKPYFVTLVEKAEKIVGRKIKYLFYNSEEDINPSVFNAEPLLIWQDD